MPRIIKMAKGSYTTTDITVDSDGRVITASTGSGGQSQFVLTAAKTDDGNFTHQIDPATTVVQAFLVGGSGGGGVGVPGGGGASGLISGPQAAPFSQPVTVGAGGAGRFDVGGATNYANFGTANGGQGGQQGPGPQVGPISPGNLVAHSPSNFTVTLDASPGMGGPGAPGSPITQPAAMVIQGVYAGTNPGSIQNLIGGPSPSAPSPSPIAGKDGGVVIFENIGP